jgi:hypothetical protein
MQKAAAEASVMMNADAQGGGEITAARFREASRGRGGGWNARRWANFLADLDRFRAALAEERSGAVAFEAADHVTQAIESGLVQPAMVGAMAFEARRFFAQAEKLIPERSGEVKARWARLEIVTARPWVALDLLDGALARARDQPTRERLIALQEEAWFASYPT